jgi:hypothetical protein
MTAGADNMLGSPVLLKSGIYMRPPLGWSLQGWIAEDNELLLLPKSRVRWEAPGAAQASLHWELGTAPLPAEAMREFINILRTVPNTVATEKLKPLYPSLIRIPLKLLSSASVVQTGIAGSMLRIEYSMPDEHLAGIVLYAPTELYEYGEYHELAYEGKDPDYGKFLPAAVAAIETFGNAKPEPEIVPEQQPEIAPEPQPEIAPEPQPEHVIKPGETVSSIVKYYWPNLDAEAVKARVGEIFLYNLKNGNPIVAWDLPPGSVVLLPFYG